MGGSQEANSEDSSSRERHTDTSTPSKFVYARPLECWPLRELIGDVYKVANMTSLRSQVIKAFHKDVMVYRMIKVPFSDEKKFVLSKGRKVKQCLLSTVQTSCKLCLMLL